MIYLHKILPILVSPIFICVATITIGVMVNRKALVIGGVVFLWLASTPLVANIATDWMEKGQIRKSVESISRTQAIVVLSGMTKSVKTETGYSIEWLDPDRFFGGLELFKAQKAPLLIFTRGTLPWEKRDKSEGDFLKEKAIEFGISAQSIRLTSEVENTSQEAAAVRALLSDPKPEIILVTSAFHMPRAKTLFEQQGFWVSPFPVDTRKTADEFSILSLLPRAGPLLRTSLAVREFVGRIYYAI